jgi:hypothetical protein
LLSRKIIAAQDHRSTHTVPDQDGLVSYHSIAGKQTLAGSRQVSETATDGA